MKKRIVFIIGGILLLFLIIGSIILVSSKNSKGTPPVIPTPTPVNIPPLSSNAIQVTETDPVNKAAEVAAIQTLSLIFNKNISPADVIFSIQPIVPFTTTADANKLLVTFSSRISPGTTYTYMINYPQTSYSQTFSFTTGKADDPVYNDNASQQNTDWSKKNEPDLYLYNQVPYDTSDFSVKGAFNSSANHFAFTVTLNGDKNQSKQNFLDWLKSLGITDQQIQNFEIQYQ